MSQLQDADILHQLFHCLPDLSVNSGVTDQHVKKEAHIRSQHLHRSDTFAADDDLTTLTVF